MDNDMRTYVIDLLESSPERKRKIALLHYELDHAAQASTDEMIEAMALGHGDGSGSGFSDGRISDKTFYIALNYQSRVGKLNGDTKKEIVLQLVELEREQERLEYYISLLSVRQAEVLRFGYFERLPWEEVASKVGVAPRTVRKIRDRAIEELAEMYNLTKTLD